jgi:hypothetical protein
MESAEDGDDDDLIEPGEHKGIPTWHEAIGVVVGANLDARARSPQQRGGRGRGGRGRGGRGR